VARWPETQRLTQTTSRTRGCPGATMPPEDADAPPDAEAPDAAAGIAQAATARATASRVLRRVRGLRRAFGCNVSPLFLEPAGLAVGLALKELRYGPLVRFAPGTESPWVPRSHPACRAGLGRS